MPRAFFSRRSSYTPNCPPGNANVGAEPAVWKRRLTAPMSRRSRGMCARWCARIETVAAALMVESMLSGAEIGALSPLACSPNVAQSAAHRMVW
jgi:hypothetical protein